MPCPSARTKLFCPWLNINWLKQKFYSRLDQPFFAVKIHSKWNFLVGRALKIHFQPEIFILNGFWNQKMDFLILDKIFVLDNFNIVLDKKYFVRADGQGIRINSALSFVIDYTKIVVFLLFLQLTLFEVKLATFSWIALCHAL